MFNIYQHMKANSEGREPGEPSTTGHDRFYQERPRTSYRKKKRRGACRRAQSAAELNQESIEAANKRNMFRIRSVSTDREDSEESGKQDEADGPSCNRPSSIFDFILSNPFARGFARMDFSILLGFLEENSERSERTPLVAQKIDSLAKLLFNKSFMGSSSGKSSPSEPTPSPKVGETSMENTVALAICTEYLSQSPRYDMMSPLRCIGLRSTKHWFAVHDNSIKTGRLLTLMPLPSQCPLEGDAHTRRLTQELFRALHHPYIYPVLALELCSGHALAVLPFNAKGSLKDLIYKSTWSDEYSRKYGGSGGKGLPAGQVARFGRQLLEGLLFLKDKGFPPFQHLHSGNIMVQNGVARISGLENTLIGARPRSRLAAVPLEYAETVSLGHVLFEMCAGADTDLELLPDLLPNYQNIVEIIEVIFGPRTPSLHELLVAELFRKIDLREMKGSCLPNFSQRLSHSCLSLLGEVARRQAPPTLPAPAAPPRRTSLSPGTPTARWKHCAVEQDQKVEWQW